MHKKKSAHPKIVFVSGEQTGNTEFLIHLMQRHPDICIFEGTDALIDSLLRYPQTSFSIHNSIFFELIFDIINDKRFEESQFNMGDYDKLGSSTNCLDAFHKLMSLYLSKTKPAATILAYRFQSSLNFKPLFNDYIIKDVNAKYVHVIRDITDDSNEAKSNHEYFLSSLIENVLPVKQKDYISDYRYEYKRLFEFLNSSSETELPKKQGVTKKLYKKSAKLKEMQNSWYNQVLVSEDAIPESVFVSK
ncbi:MAG: hypothetical protein ACHQNT_09415 [Bacteroidia bacterium]